MKKQMILPAIVLIILAGMLFAVSSGLNGIANTNAQKEHIRLLQTLLPGSETFTVEPYSGEDKNIRTVHKGAGGFVVETVTAGYVGEIHMMIGITNEGRVCGLVIRKMQESAGIGAKALTDWKFLYQFLRAEEAVEIGNGVDAISGATVTSKAIARCVNSAIGYVTGADTESGATAWGG